MVSWEKLISQPHQSRLSWNCAFFHEMGAAMAQKKSTTKANMSGALSRKKVVHKKEGFVGLPGQQSMHLAKPECAGALPPECRETAPVMVELFLKGEE